MTITDPAHRPDITTLTTEQKNESWNTSGGTRDAAATAETPPSPSATPCIWDICSSAKIKTPTWSGCLAPTPTVSPRTPESDYPQPNSCPKPANRMFLTAGRRQPISHPGGLNPYALSRPEIRSSGSIARHIQPGSTDRFP
jgi:hypothetical protein